MDFAVRNEISFSGNLDSNPPHMPMRPFYLSIIPNLLPQKVQHNTAYSPALSRTASEKKIATVFPHRTHTPNEQTNKHSVSRGLQKGDNNNNK